MDRNRDSLVFRYEEALKAVLSRRVVLLKKKSREADVERLAQLPKDEIDFDKLWRLEGSFSQ